MISAYRLTSLLPPDSRHSVVLPGAANTLSRSAAAASAPAGSAMMPSTW